MPLVRRLAPPAPTHRHREHSRRFVPRHGHRHQIALGPEFFSWRFMGRVGLTTPDDVVPAFCCQSATLLDFLHASRRSIEQVNAYFANAAGGRKPREGSRRHQITKVPPGEATIALADLLDPWEPSRSGALRAPHLGLPSTGPECIGCTR